MDNIDFENEFAKRFNDSGVEAHLEELRRRYEG